ncbi:thioesterase II family protein [Streptomyces sp. 4N124]|uniref:thioesterase II family protein n=1 Tax=Streptomyces sp. 4N124 TaxID=3457420 RepID=UPI003FD2FEC2
MESPSPAPDRPQRPGTADGLRLFVFPQAGGSRLTYRDRPGLFPADWRLRIPFAPGHRPLLDGPPITDGGVLVRHFPDRFGPEFADAHTPFALLGHSRGSWIADELTRGRVAGGPAAPVWLGISACGAGRRAAAKAPAAGPGLSDGALRGRLAALGGTAAQVLEDPQLWQVFAPAIRAGLALLHTWRPAPAAGRLPVVLSAFTGARDAAARAQSVAAGAGRSRRLVGPHVFDGGHWCFQDDPAAPAGRVIADAGTAVRADVRAAVCIKPAAAGAR